MKGCGKMFETGEYVVYGRTGICQVTGVTTDEDGRFLLGENFIIY